MFTREKDKNKTIFCLANFPKRTKAENDYDNYLEVSSLVKRIRGPEDRHFPLKHVVLVNEFHAESLDGFLLETFIFKSKCPQSAARCLCHISLLEVES